MRGKAKQTPCVRSKPQRIDRNRSTGGLHGFQGEAAMSGWSVFLRFDFAVVILMICRVVFLGLHIRDGVAQPL